MSRPWWASWSMFALGTFLFVVLGFTLVLVNKGNHPHAARYGHTDIPGSAVVVLPKGTVDLTLESDVDEGFGLRVPAGLTATVTPLDPGAPAATVTRDVGGIFTQTPGATQRVNGVPNTYKRLWHVDVAQSGRYRLTAGPPAIANPHEQTLDAGTSPKLGDVQEWERALIVYGVFLVLWITAYVVTGRRRATA